MDGGSHGFSFDYLSSWTGPRYCICFEKSLGKKGQIGTWLNLIHHTKTSNEEPNFEIK